MTECAFCRGATLKQVIDLGEVALAGAFLKPSQFPAERRFPLRLAFCEDCYALQVMDPVHADTLFRDYFYFSSQIGAVREHFTKYTNEVGLRFRPSSVLEIGCNDGYLLGLFADRGAEVIGVDPASNVVASIPDTRLTMVNDYFTEDVARDIIAKYGRQDMILANNVFAHIEDINGCTRAIRHALREDGVLVLEAHYLGDMIEGLQYDWIYHEHLYYYSCLSISTHFARHGMEIFDAQYVPAHGGSMRYFVGLRGARKVAPIVSEIMAEEYALRLDQAATFLDFAKRIAAHRYELRSMVEAIKAKGQTVAGYGASGRANTILQYCGFDSRHISHMIDDAPAKWGYHTPGTHLPIFSPHDEKATQETYTLILAWPYAREILRKIKTSAIVPLPKLYTVEREREAA